MKVLFDHQLFSYQRYGGASKYFAMLIANLPPNEWDTSTIFSNNEYVKALQLFETHHFLPNKFFRGQGRIMNELNKPYSAYLINRGDFDIFHQTHFEPYCLKYLKNKPMVTTFHDINFSTYTPNPRIVKYQKLSLERADAVIAISENTKRDLLRIFDINEKKIHVIYHGIDIDDTPTTPIMDEPYILYVGSRYGNKNFDRFAKAVSILKQRNINIKVVCTLAPFSNQEKIFLNSLKVLDSFVHLSASEQQMKSLYQHATIFVYPSLYEGFGMPILEAMANHCPALLANASCFPEIAGDAALYFDAENEDDMACKIEQLIQDSSLREQLSSKGDIRVRQFSWKRCADEHRKVYQTLL